MLFIPAALLRGMDLGVHVCTKWLQAQATCDWSRGNHLTQAGQSDGALETQSVFCGELKKRFLLPGWGRVGTMTGRKSHRSHSYRVAEEAHLQ